MNRLQVGVPDDPAVHPAIRFDCDARGKFGIHMGRIVEENGRRHWTGGGSLRLYNAIVTALVQDAAHAFGRCDLVGSEIHVVGSRVSWCADLVSYGLNNAKFCRLVRSVFDHCGVALYNGNQHAVDCAFTHCGVGLQDGGCLVATLVRCRFAENGANFTKSHAGGITLIDCVVGPQKKPLDLRRGIDFRTHMPVYPTIKSLRSLVVVVADSAGEPIRGAVVDVVCTSDDEAAVVQGYAVTDEKGMTPSYEAASDRALLLSEYRITATDDPAQPLKRSFAYRLSVTAPGFRRAIVAGVRVKEGANRVHVVLSRK